MELESVVKYFKSHNRSRIERLTELAPLQHRPFYQLLPLLFQSKDKHLPAFTKGAPFGIVDYQPSAATVDLAKKSFRGFAYQSHSLPFYPILGIYLINDNGALNYPKQPSYDLWIVYRASIPEEHLKLLKEKLRNVLNWASGLGIKIKAKLLNDTAVEKHNVADDDLDRLYSSGVVMAGSLPTWFFVDSLQTGSYAEQAQALIHEGKVKDSLLDFGPLKQRQATSLINRAIEACHNTLTQGLPYFLELSFQHTVLTQFDQHDFWLADEFKSTLFTRESDTFRFEPALLKFNKLNFAIHNSLSDHLRQSLYLLCGEKISVAVKNPPFPWRRESVANLVSSWRWRAQQTSVLDQRNRSHLRPRLEEYELTEQVTADFIAELKQFVQKHAPEQLGQISKLEALHRDSFHSAEDVIPRLPASLMPEESEEQLYLEFDPDIQKWSLNERDRSLIPQDEEFNPLKRDESVVRVLAWAILNGALSGYTRLKLVTQNSPLSLQIINGLVAYLVNSPLTEKIPSEGAQFNWLMFANVSKAPEEAFKQQNSKLSLHLRDPLNYGYHRRNLIHELEAISSPNQKDWYYIRQEGAKATAEVLASLIRWRQQVDNDSYIDCWSPTPNFAENIKKRLIQVGQDMTALQQQAKEKGTYLLELSDRLTRIQWQDGIVDTATIASRYDVNDLLAQPRSVVSTTVVDAHLDPHGLYKLLLTDQHDQQLQFYIYTQGKTSDIYIVDELGAVYKQSFTNLRETTIIGHFNKFLNQIAKLNKLKAPVMYHLNSANGITWLREVMEFAPLPQKDNFSSILVEMSAATFDSDCTIYCAGKKFSGKANDPALLAQVRDLITGMRSSNVSYPFYITNIKLPDDRRYRSSHFLVIKQKLEKLLNANS